MFLSSKKGLSFFALILLIALASCTSGGSIEVLETSKGSETVRIAVSDEVIDFAKEFFESMPGERNFSVRYIETHSGPSVKYLLNGEADIAVVSKRVNLPSESGLIYVPIAYGGMIFVCDEAAGIKELSLKQLLGIYTGKINNWKDVGGNDLPITVIDRPPHSSARIYAEELISANLDEKARRRSFYAETNSAAVEATRRIRGFIAYIVVSSPISGSYRGVPLTVEGMKPFLMNVPDTRYPIPLEIGFVAKRGASKEVDELIGYAFSTSGIHRIAALGLIPASTSIRVSECHCSGVDTIEPRGKGVKKGVLTLGVVPEFTVSKQEARYRKIAELIARELDLAVRLKHFESYRRLVEEFRKGRLDGAFVGSFVYGVLRKELGVMPVARPLTSGRSEYRGILITRAGMGIDEFADLKGKKVAYVPSTTAGELFMKTLLRQRGLRMGEFFGKAISVLSHEDAVEVLLEGKVEAAFVKDLVFERIITNHPTLKPKFEIIAKSEPVPENALVLSRESYAVLGDELKSLLLHISEKKGGKEALRALGADGFIATRDEDYKNLYSMMKQAGVKMQETL